jgi:hypothetical protein
MELTSTKGCTFTLKRQDGSVFIPKKQKIDFFGTQFTPMYSEKSWRYAVISLLNLWMKDLVELGNKEKRSKVYYENPFCETARKFYSLDEYLILSKRAFLFSLGSALNFGLSQRFKNKERKEALSEEEYNEQLNKLLQRYTYNGTVLFQKVENLNDYSSQKGIYLLCLPEVKGYYIGKTSQSLKKRITNHWASPRSDFDKYYGHRDVKEIYVLNCSESYDAEAWINLIETDCIATIGRKFALNCLAGGDTIESIHNENYDEEKHQITNESLEHLLPILYSVYEEQK